MPYLMDKTRLVIEIPEEHHSALRLEAAKRTALQGSKVSMAELIENLIEQNFPESLESVRKSRQAGEKKKGGRP